VKAGLAAIEAQMDAIGERLSEIDDRLGDLDVEPVDRPQKAAALILIESLYRCWRRDHVFRGSASLDALRPFLTGHIREHVDYVAEHPDDEICTMPFYSAVQTEELSRGRRARSAAFFLLLADFIALMTL